MTDQPIPDEDRSIFFVEFLDAGSVTFKGIDAINVSPMQLLALSGWLEFRAKSVLAQEQFLAEQQKEEQPKIEIAKMDRKIKL